MNTKLLTIDGNKHTDFKNFRHKNVNSRNQAHNY